jgi:hypothetical protein
MIAAFSIHNPVLLAVGLALLVAGYLLRSWASRHNLTDVATGAAVSAAWSTVRGGKLPSVPNEISSRFDFDDVASAKTNAGRAGKVAGYAARHFLAQVVGWAGFLLMIAGLVLGAAGMFWK